MHSSKKKRPKTSIKKDKGQKTLKLHRLITEIIECSITAVQCSTVLKHKLFIGAKKFTKIGMVYPFF